MISPTPAAPASDSGPVPAPHRPPGDWPFYVGLAVIGGAYLVLIVAMLLADTVFVTWTSLREALADDRIRYSIWLSLFSCTVAAILSVFVAVPLGYVLARATPAPRVRQAGSTGGWRRVVRALGFGVIDTVLDIPIVLPPLVIGMSLLILFSFRPFSYAREWMVFQVPGVVLAQFTVAAAFAVRTMRVTFEQITPRREHVALTLGCSRSQAFWLVALPEAGRGVLSAFTLAWARSLGEFGPILVFAGATRGRTEVLSTSVFLEFSVGRVEAAMAVSAIMIAAAVIVLVIARLFGSRDPSTRGVAI